MIAPAGPAHAAAMAALHAASFPAAEAWGEDVFAGLLASPGISGLISAAGGFILWRRAADEADVVTIAVMPDARRAGLGRALLAAALDHLQTTGVARAFLEVAEANHPAIALYAGAGFAPVGQRRGYYKNGATALLMRLDLPR